MLDMRVAEAPAERRARWTSFYAPVAEELAAVEDRLRHELRSNDPQIDALVQHAFRLGGKRLRPALLLLAAKACGRVSRDHLLLAAVVEMIHTATLVHDDVLDEASLRRHQPTLNACRGNEASVLVGDFLFTHAFYLASSLETTYACRVIGQATNTVCAGELQQVHSRGDFGLTEARYLEIIAAKTASLCACCCELGAHVAGAAPSVVAALARYGHALGCAFQIADDLLDLLGTEGAAGKSLGTDLEKQKLTLPVIRLLATASPSRKDEIIAALAHGVERDQLRTWAEESGALAYSLAAAGRFAEAARQELGLLAPSDSRRVLVELTERVVSRAE